MSHVDETNKKNDREVGICLQPDVFNFFYFMLFLHYLFFYNIGLFIVYIIYFIDVCVLSSAFYFSCTSITFLESIVYFHWFIISQAISRIKIPEAWGGYFIVSAYFMD